MPLRRYVFCGISLPIETLFCFLIILVEIMYCFFFQPTFQRNNYIQLAYAALPDPIISIIVPCYNRANYIKTVYQSLLIDQEIIEKNLNVEIIFINDGSKDNTTELIKEFKYTYENQFLNTPKIKLIDSIKKTGTLNSRMLGYKQATGNYILSLDPDDEFIPYFLNRAVSILNSEKTIEMLHFRVLQVKIRRKEKVVNYMNRIGYSYPLLSYRLYTPQMYSKLFINETIKTFKYKMLSYYENKEPQIEIITGDKLNSYKVNRSLMWNIYSYCFSRELFLKSLTIFDPVLNTMKVCVYEDYYMTYLLLYFCKTVHFIDEIGYIYYSNSPRVTRGQPLKLVLFQDINKLYGRDMFADDIMDYDRYLKDFIQNNTLTF